MRQLEQSEREAISTRNILLNVATIGEVEHDAVDLAHGAAETVGDFIHGQPIGRTRQQLDDIESFAERGYLRWCRLAPGAVHPCPACGGWNSFVGHSPASCAPPNKMEAGSFAAMAKQIVISSFSILRPWSTG